MRNKIIEDAYRAYFDEHPAYFTKFRDMLEF